MFPADTSEMKGSTISNYMLAIVTLPLMTYLLFTL